MLCVFINFLKLVKFLVLVPFLFVQKPPVVAIGLLCSDGNFLKKYHKNSICAVCLVSNLEHYFPLKLPLHFKRQGGAANSNCVHWDEIHFEC